MEALWGSQLKQNYSFTAAGTYLDSCLYSVRLALYSTSILGMKVNMKSKTFKKNFTPTLSTVNSEEYTRPDSKAIS